MQTSQSFPPVAAADARILILGSLPGAESLRRQQYYAKLQNRFWWIMGEIYGAYPALPYEERLGILRQAGVALWDVCHSAVRMGSLDSNIRAETVVPNAIGAFLDHHWQIRLLAFNGSEAEKLFDLKCLPTLSAAHAQLPRTRLPSTSPAHAAMRPDTKLSIWRETLAPPR